MPKFKTQEDYDNWRKAISESHKRRLSDPDKKAAHMEAMRRGALSSESQSKKMKKRWEDPSFRAKMTALANDESLIEKRATALREMATLNPDKYKQWQETASQSAKERLADSETRFAHVERLRKHCLSENALKKRSASMQELWASPEYQAKMAEIHSSDEYKQRASAAMLQRFSDLDERQKISEATKLAMARPEVLDKLRQSSIDRWADPEARAKLLEAATSPESRERKSIATRKKFQDPEYKAKWLASVPTEVRRARLLAQKSDPEFEAKRQQRLAETMSTWNQPSSIEKAVALVLDELQILYIQQKPIGRYFADFFLPQFNLVLECDGDYWHSSSEAQAYDAKRDKWMRTRGLNVIRLSEKLIKTDAKKLVTEALAECQRVSL